MAEFRFDKETVVRIMYLLHGECCRCNGFDLTTNRLIAQNLVNAITFLFLPSRDIDASMVFLLDSVFQFSCRDSLRSEYGAAFIYIEQLYGRFLQDLILHLSSSGDISSTLTHAVGILTNLLNTKCQSALHDITTFSFDPGIDRSLSQFQAVHIFLHRHFYLASPIVWRETQQYFEK